MVSPTIQSSDFQISSKKKCSSTNSNQNEKIKIKIEDENDEIKIFSASAIQKNESDGDIEDRLSPVVEEPLSPNRINPVNHNIPGLYTFPFFYPYFMTAAAAQANASNSLTVKTSTDGQANNLFGTAPMSSFPFPGMPFPPGMMSQPFSPNFFNPFGIPIPQHQSYEPSRDLNITRDKNRSKKPHIKKPLNAFMIYMKEQRAHVIEEFALKESSAINKFLGQKWKELSRSEQDKYYELAKQERNRHLQMYPDWSARDNYGIKKKRQVVGVQKKIPEKNKHPIQFENDPKKCRARYGLEGLHQWCKHCRRKKKCTRFFEDDRTLSNAASSPGTNLSDNDDILSRQIDSIEDDHNDSNEENKQQFHLKPSTLPSYFVY